MKVLLDSHAVFWWFGDPTRLSEQALEVIANSENTILISAVVAWELATKTNLGKLDAASLLSDFTRTLEYEGFFELPISVDQAKRAGLLPLHHRDPFDRMLVAQAQAEGMDLLSNDAALDSYDIRRIW